MPGFVQVLLKWGLLKKARGQQGMLLTSPDIQYVWVERGPPSLKLALRRLGFLVALGPNESLRGEKRAMQSRSWLQICPKLGQIERN